MGRPGLLRDADDDLTAMALAGISVLVTLTEESFPAPLLRSFGIEGRHFPIRDMGVPGLGATAGLCRSILRSVEHGERVAIHCHAGLGRTGTILAALLIYQGVKAGDALAHVRGTCARYVQSRSQELFLHQLAESLGV